MSPLHLQANYRYYPMNPPLPDTTSNTTEEPRPGNNDREQDTDSIHGDLPMSQVIDLIIVCEAVV